MVRVVKTPWQTISTLRPGCFVEKPHLLVFAGLHWTLDRQFGRARLGSGLGAVLLGPSRGWHLAHREDGNDMTILLAVRC